MRTFQQILEAAGYKCEPYIGRGMFGRECLSIPLFITSGPTNAIGRLFADVLEEVDAEENDLAADAFRKMREDSLGRDIVVYFPGITVS